MPSMSLTCSNARNWRSSASNTKWDSCKPQTQQMEAVQDQNADLQNTVAELDNQLQRILINDGINMQLEVNAVAVVEERTKIQEESGIASGFIDEPRDDDASHVLPAHELSAVETSVYQPNPSAQATHHLIV